MHISVGPKLALSASKNFTKYKDPDDNREVPASILSCLYVIQTLQQAYNYSSCLLLQWVPHGKNSWNQTGIYVRIVRVYKGINGDFLTLQQCQWTTCKVVTISIKLNLSTIQQLY